MGIDFALPLALLLLLPVAYVMVRWWQKEKQMPRGRKVIIAVLRSLVFLLLVFSLAGTQLLTPVQAKTIVFVVDRSASMKDDPRIAAFLREAIAAKQPEDQYAVVSLGGQAAVDQPLTTRDELQPLGVEVNRNATNLADGIRLAAAMIPSHARGKVVLVTDGIATSGDTARQTKLAVDRGVAVEAVSLQQPLGDEVVLSSVQMPQRLYAGEEYGIRVDVESTLATEATLRLYEGNQEAGSQTVSIEKGKNRFVFTQKAMQQGFHRYRVEIEPQKDTVQANNQATTYTQVAGAPVVLVTEGHPGAASNLVHALKAGHMSVDVRDIKLLPKEMEGYKKYATIVLADVSATQMGDADMERMRTAVRDLGMGLIMTGGADSFGMGGWFQTPIEEALPVHMDLRGKEELPSLGLQLVIDKSGSMTGDARGVDKMELAKEAAIRATTMMNGQDQIGVIAFDGSPWEVVAPQNVTKLETIQQQIGSIYADGGTDIYPALQLAYERVKTMNTKRKHVILLTDGQSGLNDDYAGLLQQMKGENITVSTVAVGDDADTQLLQMIADGGNGRYYFAADAESIPKIFSKETALASRTFIVEKPQEPILASVGGWSSLRQSLPPLRAYIATTLKQTAEMQLVSMDEDPILARWQYGLGRAAAWTSDLEGKWAPDWVSWGASSRLWNEVVAWTLPQITEGTWKTETQLEGSAGRVTVTIPAGAAMPQELEAIVLNQEMQREVIRLKPTAPGVLAGEFAAADPGSYMIQITEKESGQVVASQTTGLTVAFSPEYGMPRDGEIEMKGWLTAGGGSLIAKPSEAFAGRLPDKWDTQSISEWLLMLSALLWPFDVAARRLQLPDHWWAKAMNLWRRKPQAQTESGRQEVLSRLGEKRSGIQRGADPVLSADAAGAAEAKTPRSKGSQGSQQKESANEPDAADKTFNRLLEAKKRRTK
ncbi:VWA domain-containing protein [Brevibacillus choshinensis]|uniref:VWA domain-containing protein n=1 Tax=Brevibacillus choshinensis TaxID=54911 RepID=A0ABX7FN62_BRECH|nr:VWA domain-containing protein [Brevibacillus choshinensis]QRG67109.1 VWA domain-containing protein [Brevibacillus choshinensis]